MDTSFIDLINEDNLSKISIDENLISIFKKAMRNFQTYFNYMGYTKTRDYEKFFSKYLTTRYTTQKLSIINKSIYTNDDYMGLFLQDKRKIIIDTSSELTNTEILSTFIHEFIHFLVFFGCRDKQIKGNVIDNPFIDEALTEMLKMKILPYTKVSYLPLIVMVNFWLLVNNKNLDFNMFLNEGNFYEIDSNLKELLDMYYKEYVVNYYGYDSNYDILNNLYKKIQRNIINSLNIDIKNIDEYANIIKIISNRPLKDNDYMNKFYKKIENNICDKLNIRLDIKNKFMFYLKEYRIVLENIFRLKDYYNIEFIMDKSKYEIINNKLYIDNQFIKQIKSIVFTLKDNTKLKINLNDINISKIINAKDNYKNNLINRKNVILDILNYLKYINDLEIVSSNDELNKSCKIFMKK